MVNIPEIPEVEIPKQLPAQFTWALPVAGVDKTTAYQAMVTKYPWLDRVIVAWVRSIKCLYFAVDYNSAGPIDPRVKPLVE